MHAPDGFQFVEAPELQAVSELIGRTWPLPRWKYDKGLLELHLLRPGGDPRLAVGIAAPDGRLVSYEALIPFDIELFGATRRAVFASFFTVAPEYQGKGLSIVQEQILIERAIGAGYQIYLVMCEVGSRSNRSVSSVFAKLAIPVSVIRCLTYLAVALKAVESRLPGAPSGDTRPYRSGDRGEVFELFRRLKGTLDLRKHIPETDVDFVFEHRPHSRSYVFERAGRVCAVANVLLLEVVSTSGSSQNAYFENVSLGDLSRDEQALFVGDILLSLRQHGIHGAFLPDLGYVAVEAFRQFGFRTAPRKINLYLASLQGDSATHGPLTARSLHLDVY